jgi:23S rRNA pseudouridine1911/1915/1917 synthase
MRILFEDAHCLALVKPAGLSTQAPPIAGPTLETWVREYLSAGDPAGAYVGTVHRLDRPVSGVSLWAKSPRDARRLARQFELRQVRKVYWAIVGGQPEPPSGVWEDWLCREDTGLGRVQTCAAGTPRAQHARTRYERGEAVDLPAGRCWLRLVPETGRMHQLRVQAASRGWAIAGDRDYGSELPWPQGIALHARSLTVRHPVLGTPLELTAPVPEAWHEAGVRLPDE